MGTVLSGHSWQKAVCKHGLMWHVQSVWCVCVYITKGVCYWGGVWLCVGRIRRVCVCEHSAILQEIDLFLKCITERPTNKTMQKKRRKVPPCISVARHPLLSWAMQTAPVQMADAFCQADFTLVSLQSTLILSVEWEQYLPCVDQGSFSYSSLSLCVNSLQYF